MYIGDIFVERMGWLGFNEYSLAEYSFLDIRLIKKIVDSQSPTT